MKISSIYAIFSYIIVILFAWYAGSSEVGPDYKNYLDMIYRVTLADSLVNSMIAAKDPLFGAIVYYIDPESTEEYSYIFIVVAFLISIHRFVLVNQLGKWFLVYFFVYFFLFSPAYDFSAIRSLLGLSFVIIGIFSKRNLVLIVCNFLSILSHVSMILPIILLSDKVNKILDKLTLKITIPSLFLSGLALSSLLYLFPQTQDYIGMKGSWLLFFRSLANAFAIYIIYLITKKIINSKQKRMIKCSLYISIIALSSISVSIMTTRLMDISNYIIMIVIFMLPWRKVVNKQNFVTMLLCTSVIFVNSIYRMYSSDLFYVLYTR